MPMMCDTIMPHTYVTMSARGMHYRRTKKERSFANFLAMDSSLTEN